jgi:hypothetical protein
MEHSPELKAATLRYYEAVSQGDAGSMGRILSSQRDVAVIGSRAEKRDAEPDAARASHAPDRAA